MTYVPDDPSLDLLARYLRGDVAADERRRVEAWLAADPTRATELEDLRQTLAAVDGPRREWDLDRVWSGIEARLSSVPAESAEPDPAAAPVADERRRAPSFAIGGQRRWSGARAAAAALLVASGGAALLLQLRDEAAPEPPTIIATTRAQRLSVRLADSTLVILAPESRLEIAAAYGQTERHVRLEGEAVFTVVHDEHRPFAVETERAVARDLGTRFLVRAYDADSATEVVVAEGVVAVGRAGDADSLVVTPGELARVDAAGRLGVIRGVTLDNYFAWTDGRLVFDNTPLREVIERLERWHAVDVRLADPALGARRVTASFSGETPDQILHLVAALIGLDVQRADNVYTIRVKS